MLGVVLAGALSLSGGTVPVTGQCVLDVSRASGIPVIALMAIMHVEDGQVGHERTNRNGSRDYGPAQINSIHLEKGGLLESLGYNRKLLKDHGCVNISASAVLLRHHLAQAKGDLLEAMGRYHSRTPKYKRRYMQRIINSLDYVAKNPGKVLLKANKM